MLRMLSNGSFVCLRVNPIRNRKFGAPQGVIKTS